MTAKRMTTTFFEGVPCLQPYATEMYDYLTDRKSDKSVRAHCERFEAFARWALEVERQAEIQGQPRTVLRMPIEPPDLAEYARWLDEDQGLTLSSISSYMSILGSLHVAAGFLNPNGSDAVKNVLSELRGKYAEAAPRRARVLSYDEMERILKVLHIPRRTIGGRTEKELEAYERSYVDRALLLSMTQAGMRRSEAADLTWNRVREKDDGSGQITLPINWGRERHIRVGVTGQCLEALMTIKPKDVDDASSVFNLSGSQINRRLKRMCAEAGIDSTDISGHTPRATLHRLMVEAQAPVGALRMQLRLKPPAMVNSFIDTDSDGNINWLPQHIEAERDFFSILLGR